jgi:hypothetical protein
MPDHDDPNPQHDDNSRRRVPRWGLPLLIGLVTITAGVVTWRAGQLGSSAAFEDRQSVGQTITQQEQRTEAGLATVNDAVGYVDYAAAFAEAAAAEDLADEAAAQGNTEVAETLRSAAARLRRTASGKARAVGVFGSESLLRQVVANSTDPIPFDLEEQLAARQAEASTGITSPGTLDPDGWADRADATRTRVRALRLAAALLLMSAVAFTVAQLATGRGVRRVAVVLGSGIYLLIVGTTLTSVF